VTGANKPLVRVIASPSSKSHLKFRKQETVPIDRFPISYARIFKNSDESYVGKCNMKGIAVREWNKYYN